MPQHITIRTLGDFLDYDHHLGAYGNVCHHYQPLDLAALAVRFGRDFDTKGIRPRLRCSVCGGRDCGLIVSAGSVSGGGYSNCMPV